VFVLLGGNHGSTSTILDLRFGTVSIGSPEYGMINASVAKLARYYRLPCFVGGGASDSKIPDIQSGYEFTLSAALSALAGGNILFGAGVLEQGLTFDLATLIMDAEMIRMIQVAVQGISVTDETLAVDLIKQVGISGSFLEQPHTANHFRTELFMPKLLFRQPREEWESQGSKDLAERAEERAQALMQNTVDPKLTDNQLKELDALANRFLQQLTGR